MRLYLLRHGHAPTAPEAGVDNDFDRPISAEGRASVRKTIAYLLSQGASPRLVLSSPLKRALQTAEEVCGIIAPAPEMRTYNPLSNQIPGAELLNLVLTQGMKAPEILLVGHQPQLGEMAFRAAGQMLDLKPAGIIALETSQDRTQLLWFKNPSDL